MRRRQETEERSPQRDAAPAPQPPAGVPAPQPPSGVLALQRSAGNAAVSRAILARDLPPLAAPTTDAYGLPPLGPGLGGPIMPKPVPAEVESKVKAWLGTNRMAIEMKVQEGTTSMPEVVAEIRREVPASLQVEAYQLEGLVSEVLGRWTPPWTRQKMTAGGIESELMAKIANSLPKPPKSISFHSSAGELELSLEGVEASTKIGGAKVTAKGGTGEGEVEVKKGGASVTASAGYKGDSFGLATKVDDISFQIKVEKEKQTFDKWSMKLTVPLLGGGAKARPPAAELKEAVEKAHAAVGAVISHIAAGGSPNDEVVKKQLEAIKPAIEAVGKATEQQKGPAASVSVTAKGGGGGWFAGVSVVVEF